jgi:hypothetical protein
MSPARGQELRDGEGEHKLRIERGLLAKVAELGDDVAVENAVLVADPDAHPADHIVLIAEHLDLLVLGSRAYGPLRATLLGSVSASITARPPCQVIVVRREVKASFRQSTSGGAEAAILVESYDRICLAAAFHAMLSPSRDLKHPEPLPPSARATSSGPTAAAAPDRQTKAVASLPALRSGAYGVLPLT